MPTLDYRRKLTRGEEIRAAGMAAGAGVGVGVGVGLVALYLTRIFMQRTPLRGDPTIPAVATEPAVVTVAPGRRRA
jgi:hypothetical protein